MQVPMAAIFGGEGGDKACRPFGGVVDVEVLAAFCRGVAFGVGAGEQALGDEVGAVAVGGDRHHPLNLRPLAGAVAGRDVGEVVALGFGLFLGVGVEVEVAAALGLSVGAAAARGGVRCVAVLAGLVGELLGGEEVEPGTVGGGAGKKGGGRRLGLARGVA